MPMFSPYLQPGVVPFESPISPSLPLPIFPHPSSHPGAEILKPGIRLPFLQASFLVTSIFPYFIDLAWPILFLSHQCPSDIFYSLWNRRTSATLLRHSIGGRPPYWLRAPGFLHCYSLIGSHARCLVIVWLSSSSGVIAISIVARPFPLHPRIWI